MQLTILAVVALISTAVAVPMNTDDDSCVGGRRGNWCGTRGPNAYNKFTKPWLSEEIETSGGGSSSWDDGIPIGMIDPKLELMMMKLKAQRERERKAAEEQAQRAEEERLQLVQASLMDDDEIVEDDVQDQVEEFVPRYETRSTTRARREAAMATGDEDEN